MPEKHDLEMQTCHLLFVQYTLQRNVVLLIYNSPVYHLNSEFKDTPRKISRFIVKGFFYWTAT